MEMDSIASNAGRVIQLALTPIFLLGAISSLLGVFSVRLGRISDRVHALQASDRPHRVEIARLHMRSRFLDVAVVLAVLAGALTCASAMLLFFEIIRKSAHEALLFSLFGGALLCAVVSLLCYGIEIVLAGRTLREDG